MNKKPFLFSLLLEAGQNECSAHTQCSFTCTFHSQEKCKLPTCPEPSQFMPGQQTQHWARQATPFLSTFGGCCKKDITCLLPAAGSFPVFHLDMQIIYHWGLHPLPVLPSTWVSSELVLTPIPTTPSKHKGCIPKHPHFPCGFQGLRMHRLSCSSCPEPGAAPGVISGSACVWQHRKSQALAATAHTASISNQSTSQKTRKKNNVRNKEHLLHHYS